MDEELRREQEAEERFTEPYDPTGSGYALDDPKHPDAGGWT